MMIEDNYQQVRREIKLLPHRDRLRVLAAADAYDEIMELATGTSTADRREKRRAEKEKLIATHPHGREVYDETYTEVWKGAMDEARRRVDNPVDRWLAGDDGARADVAAALRGK
jgi:phage/plasmid-associated DNA primase